MATVMVGLNKGHMMNPKINMSDCGMMKGCLRVNLFKVKTIKSTLKALPQVL